MPNGPVNKALEGDLLQARDRSAVTTAPSQRDTGFDLEMGYQVGHALHARLLERGYQPVGRKIGFTNPATWREFNLQTPIWAPVYAQTVSFADRGCCELSLRGMVAPRLEPEIVLQLRRPLPDGELRADEVAGCVAWAALGFEIVDSHYAGWRFTAADAVADFGVHAALMVGIPWRLESEDPLTIAAGLPAVRVVLRRGTEVVATGEGRNALGSPLLALVHLARLLAGQPWAPPLRPGEVITTGTLTPPPHVTGGERWRVEAEGVPLEPLDLVIRG
jgi:2-oxo-3-hexenedioate decarboxylase